MKTVLKYFVTALVATCTLVPAVQARPQAGEVYKEIYSPMAQWRVTDRASSHTTEFPNGTYHLNVDSLAGATRAELMIIRWGGHPGTSRKRVAVGYSNAEYSSVPEGDWIDVPELATVPGTPESYMYFDNPVVDIPLNQLIVGDNELILDCGPQIEYSFDWGQWGCNGMILRLYYDSAQVSHVTGQMTAPLSDMTLGDDPTVAASVNGDVERVDFIGYYEGLDENGDGYYLDWHELMFRANSVDIDPYLQGHVGSDLVSPYQVTWDTTYVPDQTAGQMALQARIKGTNGFWYVTDPITNLNLLRPDKNVQLHKPQSVPERFWRPWGAGSCQINVPTSVNPADALDVTMHWRTWAEKPATYTMDGATGSTGGGNHEYKYSVSSVDPSNLLTGARSVSISCPSSHHGCEVMWPGPMLIVAYDGGDVTTPMVSITAPADGSGFYTGDTISIVASASDPDGTVSKVEFYANGAKIGEDTVSPYEYQWSGMSTGLYALTALVTDNDSNTRLSSPVNITVLPPLSVTATATPSSGNAPLDVQFDATGAGGRIAVSGAFLESGGTICMETENGTVGNGWTVESADFGYVGSGYVTALQDTEPVDFTVTVQSAGAYTLWVRRYSVGSADNSCFIHLDGLQVGNECDNQATYDQWIWVAHSTALNLAAGDQTVSLVFREAGYQVDRIYLTSNGDTPTGDGPAESARSQSDYLYVWDFDDGSAAVTNNNPLHTYSVDGTYQATVVIYDAFSSATDTVAVAVGPQPNQAPTADAGLTAPVAVTLDASASFDSDGSIVSYGWDFGDGQTGSGAQVTHTYTTAGNYTITLTVTDNQGGTRQDTRQIEVK